LDLKIWGTVQFLRPASKQDSQRNHASFSQTGRFFKRHHGNDDGVLPPVDFLKIRRARLPNRYGRTEAQKTSGCVSVT
jgi:hypothetical protein